MPKKVPTSTPRDSPVSCLCRVMIRFLVNSPLASMANIDWKVLTGDATISGWEAQARTCHPAKIISMPSI